MVEARETVRKRMSVAAHCILVKERNSAKHHKVPMEANVRLSKHCGVSVTTGILDYWWKWT